MKPNPRPVPYPFGDFVRVKKTIESALHTHQDTYLLLTGDTGTGKTALLRELRGELDRCHFRILYFSETRRLDAAGFVRVLARHLRIKPRRSHSETVQDIIRILADESQQLLVWLDDAQDLPEETLVEARALAECDLDGNQKLQVLLAGLPRLRTDLQAMPQLWRRIVVRQEITGLVFDELPAFLEHHFPTKAVKCLCEQGLSILFEHAKGVPGLILPMFRILHAEAKPSGTIDPAYVEDILQRWDLA